MILLGLALIAATLFGYFFIKPLSFWKNQGVSQSKKPWFVFGDSWRMMHAFNGKNAFMEFILWVYKKSKANRYFGLYVFNLPILGVADPEMIKTITIKDFDHFSDHHNLTVDPKIDPFWGGNLLILKGKHWKEMRSILSPSYTSGKMKAMFNLIMEATDNFVNYFGKGTDEVVEVNVKDIFSRFTNDVIASTAFGVKVDSFSEKNNTFYEFGQTMTNMKGVLVSLKLMLLQFAPITWKWLRLRFIRRAPGEFFSNVLEETIEQREKHNIKRPDLINILLEARNNEKNVNGKTNSVTNHDIIVNSLIFFFAGFETVSSALAFGAFELAINPDIQNRLRKEIKDTLDKNGKITYDVLQEMPYMDMVVSEILRKWPPFVLTDRKVSKPYTIQPTNENEVPVHLNVGQIVWIPIFGIQRDPEYFPDPEKFDPERFSDENKHNIRPYTYIPFGVGPRICIATRFALLEMKALLFNMVNNFEIVPTAKTENPPKLESYQLQYQPQGGFWMGLKRINT